MNGHIRCPFHEWEFDRSGQCVRIPASSVIPPFARQAAFPTALCGDSVFVFNRPQAAFDMPFFEGKQPGDLVAAKPFELDAAMPWYLVGANGFDLQHFRVAHDRALLSEPVISQPAPFAYRIRAQFEVSGSSLRDRLTRNVSGPVVTMTITSWSGTLVLVTAEFRRTTSYGMVCVRPVDRARSRLRIIVWVPKSKRGLGRAIVDPVDAAVRRSFIRAFVRSDECRSRGIRYNPATVIDADESMAGYLRWLQSTVCGDSIRLFQIGDRPCDD